MIGDFIQSWALFKDSYMVGWSMAVLLSMVGVLVIARDQVFIGAAVSQASMFGIALSIALEQALGLAAISWFDPSLFHSMVGGAFAILASLVTARAGGSRSMESPGAITGWVFLLGAAGSVLAVARNPHGMEEVQQLLSSSIIGATAVDLWGCFALTGITMAVLVLLQRRILLLVMDREMAGAVGMRVGRWEAGICIWLGLAIGLSIHVGGMTFTFGCLVLPALIAKNLCSEVRQILLVAPCIALLSTVLSFVLANSLDLPPGQVAVGLLALLLAAVWALRYAFAFLRPHRGG